MHNTKMVQWINIAEQRAQEVATGIDKEELTVELYHSGAGQEVHILEPGVAHTCDPSAAETHPRWGAEMNVRTENYESNGLANTFC